MCASNLEIYLSEDYKQDEEKHTNYEPHKILLEACTHTERQREGYGILRCDRKKKKKKVSLLKRYL